MNRLYLLVFSDRLGTQEEVKLWADRCPLIKNWRYDLPNSIYLVSAATPRELRDALVEEFGEFGRFVLTEVGGNMDGRLTRDGWEFFRPFLVREAAHQPAEVA